ncbi:GNAT family N-acetyltransferase [Bordetella muralis]|uniref:GNAT family N-acetyltransferase n=1 Tax=Bordetella muralis TaxID=1649130 RepID=UPI0039EE5866
MQEQTESGEGPVWGGMVFRALRPEDLAQAWGLSQAARWPHRLEDWQFIYPLGSGVAVLDGDQLIGVAMHWDFGSYATLGMIIVSEAYRGRGIASQLVARILNTLSAPAALLHATPHGAGVYARHGFQPVGQISQHQGVAIDKQLETLPAGWSLRPAIRDDLDALAELDRRASGLSRRPLMQALLDQGQGVVLQEHDEMIGFSMLRPFGRGELIGPVVAVDEKAARVLIAHWLAVCAGRFVRIDIPPEMGIASWLATAGLMRVDTGTRMVCGAPAAGDGKFHAYALAAQALG